MTACWISSLTMEMLRWLVVNSWINYHFQVLPCLENQLFQVCLRGWFWGWFSVLETGFEARAVYSFFHHMIPAFENWVRFSCLMRWISSTASSSPSSGESKVFGNSVWFQSCPEEMIKLLKPLTSNQDFLYQFFWPSVLFDETKQIRQNLQELGGWG